MLYSVKLPSSLIPTFTSLLSDCTEVFGYLSARCPAPVAIEVDGKFIALSPWFEKNINLEVHDSRILDALPRNDGESKCSVT